MKPINSTIISKKIPDRFTVSIIANMIMQVKNIKKAIMMITITNIEFV
ncbi:MAG: hypothetical protein JSV56_09340 [Methanomassiliicoccales archaeon]|nr:MAG: hypothetical protein JSV56_09340 [Methanomassiliicoccales archaeon]